MRMSRGWVGEYFVIVKKMDPELNSG